MKSTFKLFALVMMAGFLFTACSKEKKITRQIEGTWNINEYTESQGSSSSVTNNAGSMTFNDDNTGNITFTVGNGNVFPFTWTNTEDNITTTEDGDATVWEIVESGKSDFQLKNTNSSTAATIEIRLIK